MGETVKVSVDGAVGTLVFANPPLNFATVPLLRAIADALDGLDADPAVRAIVLAADGPTFCAGADLATPGAFGGETDDPLRELYDQALRIYGCAKPVVGAIHGAAVGAGLGLAVACDFRVAATEARFAANFVKLGFHPGFGLTHSLPRLIGAQHAAEMFLTGDRYKPEQLEAWGLVDAIVDASSIRHAAHMFAARIAVNAPLSIVRTRATLRRTLLHSVAEALKHEHAEQLKLLHTDDYAEGVRAVGERRPGVFTGR